MLCVLMTHPVFDQIENQSECVLLTQLFNLNSFGGNLQTGEQCPVELRGNRNRTARRIGVTRRLLYAENIWVLW